MWATVLNNSRASLLQLVEKIENEVQEVGQYKNRLQIGSVKEYSRKESKFKRCAFKRFIDATDHITELNVLITSKK